MCMRMFRIFNAALLGIAAAVAPRAEASETPRASVDLTTVEGAAVVHGMWRYADVALVPTQHRAADVNGQPTGELRPTWDYAPHAGGRNFDDSKWISIAPTDLATRRGNGRLSFNWYRIAVKVPASIGDFDTRGSRVELDTSIDDYAEVWVDGELPRQSAQSGGSVIGGWNTVNRLTLARNVKPGQIIHVAIFGVNGPLSDPPTNFIWMRLARLHFYDDPRPGEPTSIPAQEVNVQINRVDPAIDRIVPANAKLFKLAQDFQFTEGPIWIARTQQLLFSDPNANRIYSYDTKTEQLNVFREHSGYDGVDSAKYGQPGSNGLTLDRNGRLTLNQHGNRRVVRLEADGSFTVLADRYQGKRLNSPNDLVYKSDGAIYFTDPPFGLPKFFDDPGKELAFSGVYRAAHGRVTLLTRELRGPNGIAFSPDEKYLYVDNWDAERKVVLRFPVNRDGTVGKSELFADMTLELPGEEALDGMKVDREGNLYVTAPDGVRIYSPQGRWLGTITAPRSVHNIAWGGEDGRTLFLCASDRLYRINLLIEGIRP
jgi:gluconolactonase